MATQPQELTEEAYELQEQVRVADEVATQAIPEKNPRLLDRIVDESLSREADKLRVEEGKFEFQQRRAKLFASSGLFTVKGVSGPMAIAQAMVKIELGEAMGFTPAESLQGIHVINGVTAIASSLRAARMQAAGYDWAIDWLGSEQECTGCRLWLYFKGKPVMRQKRDAKGQPIEQDGKLVMEQVSEAFTKTDALRMMTTIWEKDSKKRVSILEKDNWKMSPRNMYFARAITNLQRFYAPRVLNINIASTEEAMDLEGDTEQSREASKPIRAVISLEQIRASVVENRGHDDTAAQTSVAANEPEPGTGEQTQETPDTPLFPSEPTTRSRARH